MLRQIREIPIQGIRVSVSRRRRASKQRWAWPAGGTRGQHLQECRVEAADRAQIWSSGPVFAASILKRSPRGQRRPLSNAADTSFRNSAILRRCGQAGSRFSQPTQSCAFPCVEAPPRLDPTRSYDLERTPRQADRCLFAIPLERPSRKSSIFSSLLQLTYT